MEKGALSFPEPPREEEGGAYMSAADVEKDRVKEKRAGLGNYSASFQLSALFFFFNKH